MVINKTDNWQSAIVLYLQIVFSTPQMFLNLQVLKTKRMMRPKMELVTRCVPRNLEKLIRTKWYYSGNHCILYYQNYEAHQSITGSSLIQSPVFQLLTSTGHDAGHAASEIRLGFLHSCIMIMQPNLYYLNIYQSSVIRVFCT